MQNGLAKPERYEFLRHRRFWWPVGAVLLLGAAGGVAVWRTGLSWVAVVNDSGMEIKMLKVKACGQEKVFAEVAEGESVRLTLRAQGGPSEITIATNGVEMWHGDYVEAQGGFHGIVRLQRDGQVDSTVTQSQAW